MIKVLFLAVVLMAACAPEPTAGEKEASEASRKHYIERMELDTMARKICVAKGGIPLTSGWDGMMKECRLHLTVVP